MKKVLRDHIFGFAVFCGVFYGIAFFSDWYRIKRIDARIEALTEMEHRISEFLELPPTIPCEKTERLTDAAFRF